MPSSFQVVSVKFHQSLNLIDCSGIETVIVRQGWLRKEPKLRFIPSPKHVNMHRLLRMAFVRIEEEAKTLDA